MKLLITLLLVLVISVAAYAQCPCINPTDNVIPMRSAGTFADSPLLLDANGNLQLGFNPAPNILNGGLTMTGTIARSNFLEVHNNYANGADLYTHADAAWRAPYISFYKSRGTQTVPNSVLFTGYELDSIGGINFGGWDGVKYFGGAAAIYAQSDENWTTTHHGGHLAIYGTSVGGNTRELIQFGGKDSTGVSASNIIFYDNLSFGGNQYNNPAIFPESSCGGGCPPAALHAKGADNSRDVDFTALNISASASLAPGSTTVSALPAAATKTGRMFSVSDSTPIASEGQVCVSGGTDKALAFSNGVVWKCF